MNRTVLAITALICVTVLGSAALIAGPLDPPAGAVTPTLKTLTEVEPRVAINQTNTPGDASNTYIIASPGSYYLTANLVGELDKHAISIQADGVTLDLSGFEVLSGGGTTRGIDVPGPQTDLAIRNGTIRGWADGGVRAESVGGMLAQDLRLTDNLGGPGLALGTGAATNCIATRNATGFSLGLGASLTGCTASANTIGFQTGDRASLSNCVATTNSAEGFNCGAYVSILDCSAGRNGGTGIVVLGSSTVSRCTATRNIPLGGSPGGSGISAGPGCTITACNASNNAGSGILAGSDCIITDCSALGNSLIGISISDRCTLTNCSASQNGFDGIVCISYCVIRGNTCSGNGTVGFSAGIQAFGAVNRIEGNNCTANDRGIDASSAGNFIVRNTCSGNFMNWDVAAGNVCLVVVGVGAGTINGNSGGLAPGSTDPNANFSY